LRSGSTLAPAVSALPAIEVAALGTPRSPLAVVNPSRAADSLRRAVCCFINRKDAQGGFAWPRKN
jgi:hypothetical protein